MYADKKAAFAQANFVLELTFTPTLLKHLGYKNKAKKGRTLRGS